MSDRQKTAQLELEIALTNRAFEIQLFWQRTNYFLVLITALGVGVFSVKSDFFSILIATLGVFSSFLWFRTNLGSKFWQESWEVEVSLLSKEQGIRSFEKNITDIRLQVTNSLKGANRVDEKPLFRRWIDGLVIKKYSVTNHMITLSLFTIFIWVIILIAYLLNLLACVNFVS